MRQNQPTYNSEAFKTAFSDIDALAMTFEAANNAAEPGFRREEIAAIIQTMTCAHFYKIMPSHKDSAIFQDVYHVPSCVGVLYVKFTADTVTVFRVLSFKEK